VDQVISFGAGFLGVVQPFDILERGSTWGFGLELAGFSIGFAEWETKNLAQNWPTAYFQMPSSEDWFFDHATTIAGKTVNRAFIRDYRVNLIPPYVGPGDVTSYAASMRWTALAPDPLSLIRAPRHNATLAARQVGFFNPPAGPALAMGDFRAGTGAIYHHRIISKGRMDTVVATVVAMLPSEAGLNPITYGITNPLSIAVELTPNERSWKVEGDGDSTIPYHGALGMTLAADDRAYIIDGILHGDIPNIPEVLGDATASPPVKGLLQFLLEGSICSQTQAPPVFVSQNTAVEIV
jgi:hypothetical protein